VDALRSAVCKPTRSMDMGKVEVLDVFVMKESLRTRAWSVTCTSELRNFLIGLHMVGHCDSTFVHYSTSMSPVRRYLRITKYSVLEVRIYLEKPSDASWLLSSREPILSRIIEEVRPLVLPKLREENENAKKKSSKKQRGIKDVVSRGRAERLTRKRFAAVS